MIVAVFMIACFALCFLLYERYGLALSVAQGVRTELWARASPGCPDGTLDSRLRGAYSRYEVQQVRWAPVLGPFHDTPRVLRVSVSDRGDTTSGEYMGSLPFSFRTTQSTTCNETPDTPEDRFRWASIDTYCRVSDVCDPAEARELAGERAE
ncbi:MAG: hypothetical protein IT378_01405 [Sandaracinaceae bacterium]|nr:hypothetical protein [Sandaracinaceae bacterium]MCC6872936.1 hypothetical protein [Sandaracinaceae bacterium]